MNSMMILCVCGLVLLVLVILLTSYVKAPPSYAYLISGISKQPRVLIGRGGFRIPFLERIDKVYLGQMSVDIKTNESVPTRDFLDVSIDGIAKVRVNPSIDGIRLAGKNFLNMTDKEIQYQLKDSLEGNMREIIGTLDLISLTTDRDSFSDQISLKASKDMDKLGIEILSCNIQSVTDKQGLIKDLGADNTWKIRKEAAKTKANAEKEIAVAESEAKKESNDARVLSETAIAEKNNELDIKKAELQQKADTKKAIADAAYMIQKQEQQATINQKTVDAEIEKTRREQVLSQERITIKENELAAEVNKKADADKYEVEIKAQADLELRKRNAEAELYAAEQKAAAVKAQAEADKYAKLQEAEGIRAVGEAEASAAKAKYIAEAEGLEKKADAYEKFGKAAIMDMIVKILPEMSKNVAEPLKSIDNVNIYGSGSEVSGISGNVPTIIKQTFDTVESATGVNLAEVLKANTIDAKVNRNVNLDLDGQVKNVADYRNMQP